MTRRRGMLTPAELEARVAAGEIDTVVLAFTDMQGRLQEKRFSAEFSPTTCSPTAPRAATTCSPSTCGPSRATRTPPGSRGTGTSGCCRTSPPCV
jgi:hypothetical protein